MGFLATSCTGTRVVKRYPWEEARKSLATTTDAILCYGGSHHRTPYLWDQARLAPLVTYTDPAGREHWLFDGFIFLEFQDTNRPDNARYAFETGQLRDTGVSAGKAQWQELIDYYFRPGNGVDALDKAVKEATGRLGNAPAKRRVIMVLPDPVIYEHYIDTTSSTTYWGELDGRRLDFSKNEDRLAACKWYIDRVRAAFAAGNYRYVELAGFYWLREIVTRPQDTAYSYFLTRSDILLPHVADYLHRLNYSFNWIPYYGSRGYDVWPTFGFDQAYLQPNYYWKAEHDMEKIFDPDRAIRHGDGVGVRAYAAPRPGGKRSLPEAVPQLHGICKKAEHIRDQAIRLLPRDQRILRPVGIPRRGRPGTLPRTLPVRDRESAAATTEIKTQ